MGGGTNGHFHDRMLRFVLWNVFVNTVFAMRRVQDLRCYFRSSMNDVDCFGTLKPIALLWLEKWTELCDKWHVNMKRRCLPFFKLIAITAVLIFPFVVAYRDIARFIKKSWTVYRKNTSSGRNEHFAAETHTTELRELMGTALRW